MCGIKRGILSGCWWMVESLLFLVGCLRWWCWVYTCIDHARVTRIIAPVSRVSRYCGQQPNWFTSYIDHRLVLNRVAWLQVLHQRLRKTRKLEKSKAGKSQKSTTKISLPYRLIGYQSRSNMGQSRRPSSQHQQVMYTYRERLVRQLPDQRPLCTNGLYLNRQSSLQRLLNDRRKSIGFLNIYTSRSAIRAQLYYIIRANYILPVYRAKVTSWWKAGLYDSCIIRRQAWH